MSHSLETYTFETVKFIGYMCVFECTRHSCAREGELRVVTVVVRLITLKSSRERRYSSIHTSVAGGRMILQCVSALGTRAHDFDLVLNSLARILMCICICVIQR